MSRASGLDPAPITMPLEHQGATGRAGVDDDGDATQTLQPWARIQIPERIGRLTLAETLGEGGMGVVVAAHDAALDRRVAVKLIRGSGDRQRRLLREARAMARLSHPNVVEVYDAGTVDDRVYLSMELVRGQTLKQWLKARPRACPQILEAFTLAGRGLAAAHRAGLVHRDFKPSNVLVADDGRVLVTDFGLARAAGAGDSVASASASAVVLHQSITLPPDDVTMFTASDVMVGTPPYMPPEQHMRGETIDERSDQFAFCAALYEALYGVKPFTGETMMALLVAKRERQLQPPRPESPEVPRRVQQAMLRGLSGRPEQRWPTMDTLLAQLSPGPRRARTWVLGGVGAVALATASILASSSPPTHETPPPDETPASPALVPIPDDITRQLREAQDLLRATLYDQAAATARAALDDARARAHPRARTKAALLLGRIELTRSRLDVAQTLLTDALHDAQAQGDDRAVIAAALGLGRLHGLSLSQPEDGLRWVRHAEGELQRIAPDDSLHAEVLWLRGQMLGAMQRADEADLAFARALKLAEGLDPPATWLVIDIRTTHAVGLMSEGRHQRAVAMLEEALADAREQWGQRHPATANIAFDLSVALQQLGRWDEVEALRRDALQSLEVAYGPDHPAVASALRGLGDVMLDTGRRTEGEPYYRRALSILERTLADQDPNHPSIIQLTERLAQSVAHRGDVDEALVLLRRAITMARNIDERALEYRVRRVMLWTLRNARRFDDFHREADALGRDLSEVPDPLASGSREDRAIWAESLRLRGRREHAATIYRALFVELADTSAHRERIGYGLDLARLLHEQGQAAATAEAAARTLDVVEAAVDLPAPDRERWRAELETLRG